MAPRCALVVGAWVGSKRSPYLYCRHLADGCERSGARRDGHEEEEEEEEELLHGGRRGARAVLCTDAGGYCRLMAV